MSAPAHSEVAPENQHDGTIASDVDLSAGRRKVARSRGVFSGILLIILGAWAALAPFIGPYFDFGIEPRSGDAWHWTDGRGLYELLPGGIAVLGGIVLLVSASRALTVLMSWLAALAGVWLVVGPSLQNVINVGSGSLPDNTSDGKQAAYTLLYFLGTGALIVLVAGIALGRLSVHSVRDVRAAEHRAELEAAAEAHRREAERVELERRDAERIEHERREHERRDAEGAGAGLDPDRRTAALPVVDGHRDHDARNAPTAAHPVTDDDRYAAPAATPYEPREPVVTRDTAGSSGYSGQHTPGQHAAAPDHPGQPVHPDQPVQPDHTGAHAEDPAAPATPATAREDDPPHDPSTPPAPGGMEQYRYGTAEHPVPPEERGR